MSGETLTFVVGWLAGLLPSLITVYIGYRFPRKNAERKRKTEILSRRLDRMESVADTYLDTIREIGALIDGVFDNSKCEDVAKRIDLDKL